MDEHLAKCIVYIDLYMVRAGVVRHPFEYRLSGFNEIQNPPKRYAVIDRKTLTSWSKSRRVVGKAEQLMGRANPRFVVTSLSKEEHDARPLYEDVYCARGDMENRIKEKQLMLFTDRASSSKMRATCLIFTSAYCTTFGNTCEICGLRDARLFQRRKGLL